MPQSQDVHRPPRRLFIVRPLKRAGERLADRYLSPASLAKMSKVPSLPPRFRRRYAAVRGPWQAFDREIPQSLRTFEGIHRDVEAENEAFASDPLHSFHHNYPTSVMWGLTKLWQSVIPVAPRLMRAVGLAKATGSRHPVAAAPTLDPDVLTERVRARAEAIGLSMIGVARHDPRYTFVDQASEIAGDTVIVCILEQNWPATQTIPGPVGEQTALSTNAEVIELVSALATWLQDLGYEARAHTTEGVAIIHHYAVEAGLGQLGYNGQLLTPQAGSRCRLAMVSTTAPLRLDAPRDFGIPGICSRCRACVRRCPSGAIPARPAMHRGVEKSKLRLDRCFPVVSQANGCSVCLKVCPVQRYGLRAVLDHYEREDGAILGAGTDELEGYDWPLDGLHYGPGERPYLDTAFFDVPGFGTQRVDNPESVVTANPLM